jgi:DUF1680 family protein
VLPQERLGSALPRGAWERGVVVVLLCAAVAQAADVIDTRESKYAKLRPIGLEEVRWTKDAEGEGFWARRMETLRSSSIPAMWEIMKGSQYKPYLQHFLIAAGAMEGRYRGAQWNDGDFYKFLEGVTATYAVARDQELAQILDESISAIGRAQRDDGYIHTPVLIGQRNGDKNAQPFQDRHNFEMYNMGHLITAACLHHRVTGSDNFLDIARKTADFLYDTFRDPTPELARNSVCPSHYMALVELYRTTREPRYLELAQKFLDMRNMVEEGGDDNQDRVPFTAQREAVGHAVRANYLYAGAADLFLETGDKQLMESLEPIWQNVVDKKMYITGGCGALYDGASPDGSEDQQHITRTHQAYGRNYQLPNTTAHNETCAAIGSVLWNWRMFLATGEARYMDVLELGLYNAVLSGVSIEGSDYFYVNPLRQVKPLPTDLRWSRERVPFVTSYCCPPNVLRTIAEVNGYAYSKSDDSIWVNLYGANQLETTLSGKPLKLTQRTRYPWEGVIGITIDEAPDSEFALKLRIPGSAEKATVEVNGSPVNATIEPGTYFDLRRRWKKGDFVGLHIAQPLRLMEANPLVEEARNQVAFMCGPVVYCLESVDLPQGVRVQEVRVPLNGERVGIFERDLMGGVAVIDAEVVAQPSGDWDGKLYRTARPGTEKSFRTRFIPYFAWGNRGKSEMSVWLPAK